MSIDGENGEKLGLVVLRPTGRKGIVEMDFMEKGFILQNIQDIQMVMKRINSDMRNQRLNFKCLFVQ